MSEPAAKHRQMIDLDEFERRLSRSPAPARGNDPLAELARLVNNGEDRFESMFQTRPARARAAETPSQPVEPHVPDWLVEESHQHQHAQPEAPRRAIDFAAIEAGLRGSLPPEFQNFTDAEDLYLHASHASNQHHTENEDFAEESNWLDAPYVAPQEPIGEAPRSRLPLYATAAIILVGMAGIGGTFALKRTPAAPQEIALIKASTVPVKVAVPGADTSAAADGASILDKTPQPAPIALVSHNEQPVDVNAVGKPAPDAAPAQQVSATAPATAVPVPAPPGGGDATQDLADMMQPHKVKTVAVRPDGSLADSPDPAAPAAASAAPPVNPIAPPSMAAGGASLANPPPEMTKTASAGDDLPWSPQAAQPSPAAPAAAAAEPPARKPVEVARTETSADDAAEAPAGGTGFSVQLAAPGSEAEAHAALVRLSRTYGAELHGYRLKYRMAKVNGKTVYRVRVNGLSHKAAISLCEKLKAKGASCFPAKG